jgi:hypothetical protein
MPVFISHNRKNEREIIAALRETLTSLPNVALKNSRENVRFRSGPIGYDADAILDLDVNGKKTVLLIEAKNSVFPRDARETIWQLRNLQAGLRNAEGREETVPIIASKTISDGAKEFLRSENIGYYEEGGSLFLSSPDIYVLLDKPRSKKADRVQRTLFSGRRSQVLHALLDEPDIWRGVKELSTTAFASAATVSQVLLELERREWVDTRGSGPHKERKLRDPRSLLDAWAKHIIDQPKRPTRRFFVPTLKAEELLHKIAEVCESHNTAYEITGEWAAQIYSPFLSSIAQVRCRVPADSSGTVLVQELSAREVSEGSNLVLLETMSHGDFLFRRQKKGVWLANPITVYLDLQQAGGRAKEMAEHLRRETIRF